MNQRSASLAEDDPSTPIIEAELTTLKRLLKRSSYRLIWLREYAAAWERKAQMEQQRFNPSGRFKSSPALVELRSRVLASNHAAAEQIRRDHAALTLLNARARALLASPAQDAAAVTPPGSQSLLPVSSSASYVRSLTQCCDALSRALAIESKAKGYPDLRVRVPLPRELDQTARYHTGLHPTRNALVLAEQIGQAKFVRVMVARLNRYFAWILLSLLFSCTRLTIREHYHWMTDCFSSFESRQC